MSLREYEAIGASSVELKSEMNRLVQKGWKRIRYTPLYPSSYFIITASRKYRICPYGGCKARLYAGDGTFCPEHAHRWSMEYDDLRSRSTSDYRCVEGSCLREGVTDTYCGWHEAKALENYALKGKASDREE